MNNARRFVVRHWLGVSMTAGALVAGALGYLVGERRFGDDRVQALKDIDTYRQVLADAAQKAKARPELDAKLQSLADRAIAEHCAVFAFSRFIDFKPVFDLSNALRLLDANIDIFKRCLANLETSVKLLDFGRRPRIDVESGLWPFRQEFLDWLTQVQTPKGV